MAPKPDLDPQETQEWLDALKHLGTDENKPFLETAPWLISMPSFRNSPWMRGAPQSGLARDI